jgi:8-oxo-dGTP diphosphatase
MNFSYQYPRPALTIDCVIFGFDESELKILLIERGIDPFKGKWALPGGFVRMDETTEITAIRELSEETGMDCHFLEQLYTFSDIKRDPRERVITVAYFALVKLSEYKIKAGDDAKKAQWFPVTRIPELAFDHELIFQTALNRLKGKIRYQPVGFDLLPEKFTLSVLQHLYEAILGKELDKRNFRKKILKMDLLIKLDEKEENVAHKAAYYFKFDKQKYEELTNKGFNFEL